MFSVLCFKLLPEYHGRSRPGLSLTVIWLLRWQDESTNDGCREEINPLCIDVQYRREPQSLRHVMQQPARAIKLSHVQPRKSAPHNTDKAFHTWLADLHEHLRHFVTLTAATHAQFKTYLRLLLEAGQIKMEFIDC